MKKPPVAKAIEETPKKGRDMAAYGLVEAMKEADDVIAFTKMKGNAMAYCKAVELRAKLSGLLVERVEIATVDLTGALAAAERRVIDVTVGTLVPSRGSICRTPHIPGNPVPENPEAGRPDGESARRVNNGGPENR